MSLKKHLENQGFDLIDGPIRNHKPLQLWLKRSWNEPDLYYDHLFHAFTESKELKSIRTPALDITSDQKNEYSFNIGISILENLLESLGMGELELALKIKRGKKVSISYTQAQTREYSLGKLEEYFFQADFSHSNRRLLKYANRNQIILISGVMVAQNLQVTIETESNSDFNFKPSLISSLNELSSSNVNFASSKPNNLEMTAKTGSYFPIALKACRLDFDRGEFKKLIPIKGRDWF